MAYVTECRGREKRGMSEWACFLNFTLRGKPRWVRPELQSLIHTGKCGQGVARPRWFDEGPCRFIEVQVWRENGAVTVGVNDSSIILESCVDDAP